MIWPAHSDIQQQQQQESWFTLQLLVLLLVAGKSVPTCDKAHGRSVGLRAYMSCCMQCVSVRS